MLCPTVEYGPVGVAPLLHISFGMLDDRVLPKSASGHQTGDALWTKFAIDQDAMLFVTMKADVSSTDLQAYAERIAAIPKVAQANAVAGTISYVSISPASTPPRRLHKI